jgi:hypothetical protein
VDRIMRREGVFDLAFRVLQVRKGRNGSSFGGMNMDEKGKHMQRHSGGGCCTPRSSRRTKNGGPDRLGYVTCLVF